MERAAAPLPGSADPIAQAPQPIPSHEALIERAQHRRSLHRHKAHEALVLDWHPAVSLSSTISAS
jgi:hypothetical protein